MTLHNHLPSPFPLSPLLGPTDSLLIINFCWRKKRTEWFCFSNWKSSFQYSRRNPLWILECSEQSQSRYESGNFLAFHGPPDLKSRIHILNWRACISRRRGCRRTRWDRSPPCRGRCRGRPPSGCSSSPPWGTNGTPHSRSYTHKGTDQGCIKFPSTLYSSPKQFFLKSWFISLKFPKLIFFPNILDKQG